ncbi:sodium:solute symporter [Microbulbifer hydrolyticus]|uniref:SSS family transporter n=1 Tax=Microbulbifer hydrolyticus TaxID=48074 RepID=A0A6P1TAZ5_9GAMM|nr:sodium:solute symporter [Microbulbifer hydrolyticus]MBB5210748.1 SSS family transporter [Microbulbifer hydrolyticus]QHQ38806.1 sodium:solute symporter [Microbulbifer hydrolyticus]
MELQFTGLDWGIFALYLGVLAASGWYFSQNRANNSRDYFLAGNSMPMWMVAISTLATTQSAATFLGGPDLGYRGDLTYLFTNVGAVIAAIVVARFLIPRFYAHRVTTVYELLQSRFGEKAKNRAGGIYLLGRVFASGARLYMAAIAVSMILFNDIAANHVIAAVILLTAAGLLQTLIGGVRSVIQSDVLQCIVYVSAAVAVVAVLLWQIPADMGQLFAALNTPPGGEASKLTLVDTSWDLSDPFNLWATLTGFVLLNIAAFGLDQDVTQRILTCKTPRDGARAVLFSVVMVVPVMAVFMGIGLLLHIFYQNPQLMAGTSVSAPSGGDVTVFMHYVLNEMPAGLRGLVTIGVIAAALSTLNSSLNSMASVLTEDLYRHWLRVRGIHRPAAHFVRAGRWGMALVASALGGMAILCFFWQQISDLPLITFALSVMVFAYSGLLGVFFTVLLTRRGNASSVGWALAVGFVVTLLQQPWMITLLTDTNEPLVIAFPWQLCLGTLASFAVCNLGKPVPESTQDFTVTPNQTQANG